MRFGLVRCEILVDWLAIGRHGTLFSQLTVIRMMSAWLALPGLFCELGVFTALLTAVRLIG